MWRRLSAHLQTLASPRRPLSNPLRILAGATPISTLPICGTTVVSRCFSSDAGAGDVAKSKPAPEDINPTVTGLERLELEAELEGRDLYEFNYPVGPFGTKEEPAVVKSFYNKRIVGCPGGLGEDEHDVLWFWLEKDKPFVCPVCSQYFMLEVMGPGGDPVPPSDDEGHGHVHH